MIALDHLVIGAHTLEEGVAWCKNTLGITPGPGGQHAWMGTHNRLFSIASERFPKAYAEIIAVDPSAPPPSRTRWFDLDDPRLQAALTRGPQLIHWVARTPDINAQLSMLRQHGCDGGEAMPAERETPRGLLRWRISVRPDGRRLCEGALPTWIAWGEVHPTDHMPASGVELDGLSLSGIPVGALATMALPTGVGATAKVGDPALQITLTMPHGRVMLSSTSRWV
ncbi:MAG: VOC family protein [Rhizobacter sp.]